MKQNTIKSIALLLIAALATAGCRVTTEQSEELSPALRTIVFRAREINTKTTFGPGQNGVYPTLWTGGDKAVKLALNFSEAAEAAVVPDEGGRTASFTADIDASQTQAPYTFYAVSPASAARALSPSRQAWSISIPASQTPTEGSVDEAAQILAASSAASDALPADIDLHFNHLTAYGRMTLKNLNLNGATVECIDITASTPIVGDWYWDCSEGHALTDNGASSTITLNTSSLEDIWFACAPVDMSGQSAKITVYTDMGAYSKDIQFPEGRKFTAGRIAVFSVDLSGIGPEVPSRIEDDPITEFTEYGCYINGLNMSYAAGTDQYSRRYSNDGIQTFTLLDPQAKEQLEITGYRRDMVKGDDITVTLTWRKGFNTISKGTNYKLKVVKEDGPKVWLGKGNGEGFIIKK